MAQVKGVTDIVVNENNRTKGNKYALIVGVSKYKDDRISLKFADKDAVLFRNFLIKSNAVKTENIISLLNNAATGMAINVAVENLAAKSKPNDTVYIYFSGHGDVQTNPITKKSTGYLLGFDANADRVYKGNGGLLELNYLQEMIDAMASNQITVNLILDACHSSFIINEDGAKMLSNIAMGGFANTIRYLSCLPTQKSYEDPQLGQGYFTYYLIKGLMGMADNMPKDNQVSVNELSQYLMTEVLKASNNKQLPKVEALNPLNNVQNVRPDFLQLLLQNDKASTMPVFLASARSVEQKTNTMLLAGKPTTAELIFIKRINALFLQGDAGLESIYNLYKKGDYKKHLSLSQQTVFKNTLADALAKKPQEAVNTILMGKTDLPNGDYFRDAAKQSLKVLSLLDTNNYTFNTYSIYDKYLKAYAIIREKNYRRYNYADSLLNEALIIQPDAAFVLHGLGLIADYKDDAPLAEKYFQQAIDLIPTWIFPRSSLGNSLRSQGKYKEAITVFEQTIKMNPKFSWSYNNLAGVYFDMGSYTEAEQLFKKAIQLDPEDSAIPKGNLGLLYKQRGNIKLAEKYLKDALKTNPKNVEAYLKLGELYNENNIGGTNEGFNLLKKANKMEPYYADALIPLADYYRNGSNTDDYAKADSLYASANINSPFSTWAYAGRGWNIIDSDTTKALSYFETNLKINANKPSAHKYMADVLSYIGDTTSAIAEFNKAIELNPYYYDGYKDLAELYFDKKDSISAEKTLLKAMPFISKNPNYLNDLGNFYYQIGKKTTALAYYKQALIADTAYALAYGNIAYAALEAGDIKLSVISMKKARDINAAGNSINVYNANYELFVDKLIELKDYNTADSAFSLYQNTFEMEDELKYKQALIYYLTGNYSLLEKSVNNNATLTENNSHYLEYLELLGWAMIDQSKFEIGKSFLKKAIAVDKRADFLGIAICSFAIGDKIEAEKYLKLLQNNPYWKKDALNRNWFSELSNKTISSFINKN